MFENSVDQGYFLLVTKMLQGGACRFAPSFNMPNANQVHSFQF